MKVLNIFWGWYEKHKTLNLGIAAFLFTLQLAHLIWLFGDVIYFGLFGKKLFNLHEQSGEQTNLLSPESIMLVVDYLEIPAIISTSLVYLNEIRHNFNTRSLIFFLFINSQWLHLFWITDEFVIDVLSGIETETVLPLWLAWVAILIDYMELPVIVDTLKKFFRSLKNEGVTAALEKLQEDKQSESSKN